VVTTNITVRDTARITGHPIADFLALFSILISSPLIAGLSSPDYYNNCQKAIFSRERHFSIHILFFNLCNSALCIKFTAGLLLYSISCNFYKSYDAFKDILYVISDSKSQGNTGAITLHSDHSFLLDCMDTRYQLYATIFSQPYNRTILDNGSHRSHHTFHFSFSS
jgi:hypothetical protein